MDNMKIFVVEDDAVIASAVKRSVEAWGCDCRVAQDFRAVLQEFVAYDPQLVLMDITLPFYNGYHWCSEIRKLSKVPVMFLSSASDNMNIVMAMNMGGDDFIAKPFDLSVLTAKVQAMLRRTYELICRTEQPAGARRRDPGRKRLLALLCRHPPGAEQERVPHFAGAHAGGRRDRPARDADAAALGIRQLCG